MMLGLGGIILVILVVVVVVILINNGNGARDFQPTVRGRIDQPENGASVSHQIHCSGEIHSELINSRLIFRLAIEVGGLIWPNEELVIPDQTGHWEQTIFKEGSPRVFTISLWVVNPHGEKQIRAWFERGKLTNDFQGTTEIPGAQRLAQVNRLQLLD